MLVAFITIVFNLLVWMVISYKLSSDMSDMPHGIDEETLSSNELDQQTIHLSPPQKCFIELRSPGDNRKYLSPYRGLIMATSSQKVAWNCYYMLEYYSPASSGITYMLTWDDKVVSVSISSKSCRLILRSRNGKSVDANDIFTHVYDPRSGYTVLRTFVQSYYISSNFFLATLTDSGRYAATIEVLGP